MANKIHIIGDYYYTADDNQFILLRCGTRKKIDRKTRKETDEMIEYEEKVGYYVSLYGLISDCVTHINRNATMDGDIKTLNDAIKHIDSLFSDINDKILI